MKRHLLLLAVMFVASLFFSAQSRAQVHCDQDTIDLGICDTIYVETFDCDHIYDGTAGYDSVRVAVYVTHDSNTYWWEGGQRWVQDSISCFWVPLRRWKEGCADSVVLPTWGNWNNKTTNRTSSGFKRSIFRDLVDCHTGDTIYNRYTDMMMEWEDQWSTGMNFKGDSAFVKMVSPGFGKWWEGKRVLLYTMTFLVYMGTDCESTAICLDSTLWSHYTHLSFTRYDAVNYVPRHFLSVCDTIYIMCGDCNGDGAINSADVVCLRSYLFIGGPRPGPLCKADANGDDKVNLADAVYLINYLFIGGPPPSPCCAGGKIKSHLPQTRSVPEELHKVSKE